MLPGAAELSAHRRARIHSCGGSARVPAPSDPLSPRPRPAPNSQLYLNHSTAAQEAACAALGALPPPAQERFLLQLVYLGVSRPSTALERAVAELCRHSLRAALRVRMGLRAGRGGTCMAGPAARRCMASRRPPHAKPQGPRTKRPLTVQR